MRGAAPLREGNHVKNVIIVITTALGSRIPPHAVVLQVNENTPVKLKIIIIPYLRMTSIYGMTFVPSECNDVRNDVRTIAVYIYIYTCIYIYI